MTDKQQPIDSGYGFETTALEVLDGVDLGGKTAVITGGYSGIGLEATRGFVKAGASVVVPARRPDLAAENLDGIGAEIDELNLADLGSVASFASRWLDSGRPIDFLINGAGVMAAPETRVGPGWELQFAVNHVGHYALTNRLWPVLRDGGARVVTVASGGHANSPIRWHDLHFNSGYDRWTAYAQSKTANVLFSVQLDRLGRDQGVRAFSLDPGAIRTPLQRYLTDEEMREAGWIDEDGNVIASYFKSTEQGAATQTWAAVSPQLEGMGGLYLVDCDVARSAPEGSWVVRPYAIDPDEAERLWTVSAAMTGVDAFA